MWLATATRYARRNGHDDPIPLTLRYPGLAYRRRSFRSRNASSLIWGWRTGSASSRMADLDLIGPVASATLTRTGPLWPPNAYVMTPLVEAARGGVFVFITGLTDFFSWWRWAPLVSVLERHRRPVQA